jgi:hypothetical protein
MRSSSRSFRGPNQIMGLINDRAAELGYSSGNAYLLGLVVYDLLTRREHSTTLEISQQKQEEQDKIYDEIARMFGDKETLKGSWFQSRLEEAVKTVADGRDIPTDRVVSALLDRIKDKSKQD